MTIAFPIIMFWLAINAAALAIGCARWARIEAQEENERQHRAAQFRKAMARVTRELQTTSN